MALIDATLDDIVKARRHDVLLEKQKMSSSASSYKVAVGNLNRQDLNVSELNEMFSDFGKILSLKVVAKDGKDNSNVSIRYG